MGYLQGSMKASVLYEPFKIKLEDLPLPKKGPNDVLVKVMAVGICGSDIHYYEHGRIGDYIVENPIILGHECAGEVVAIGSEVKSVKVGDRVAIEPGVTCGICKMCKAGNYNLCPDVQFYATPPVDGCFSQYVVQREDFLFTIPDNMSYEEAAMIEPLSVGIHASNLANISPGDDVAILGMGPVGLLSIIAAKSRGAKRIFVSDIEELRLEVAKDLGATHTVNVTEQEIVQIINDHTGGNGVDVVLETAGSELTIQDGVNILARNGTLSLIGLPPKSDISLNIPYIVDNQIKIQGVFRYANTYETGINLLQQKSVNIENMITHKYNLEDIEEAMECARLNKSNAIKVIVYPNGIN